MSSTPPHRPGRFVGFTTFVCIVAAFVAGLMGAWASDLYRSFGRADPLVVRLGPFGLFWGAATGVLAGIIWCRVMIWLATFKGGDSLGGTGAILGIGVGLLSAVLLHGGLMLLTSQQQLWPMGIGLAFAIPVGAIVGAVCGGACGNVIAAAGKDIAQTPLIDAPQVAKPPHNPNDPIG